MFNVEVDTCDRTSKVDSIAIDADSLLAGKLINPNANVAYIVPWGDAASTHLLIGLLRNNVSVKSASKSFITNQKRYPSGSLIIEKSSNRDIDLATIMTQLTESSGAVVDGVNSSWVSDGPSFGSGNVVTLKAPKIAMAWDTPTSSLSAGNTRFVIERTLGYPVTAIRVAHLARADLTKYDVLIMPSGRYQSNKGMSGNIASWVRAGGVLITLGEATAYAASNDTGLLALKRELALKDEDDASKKAESSDDDVVDAIRLSSKEEYFSAIESDKESPDSVPGILAKIDIDTEHWLAAGVNSSLYGLVVGNNIYQPIKLGDGVNIASYTSEDALLASGYLWKENLAQMPFKPFMVQQPSGKGMVIAFTQDIAVRAYLDGLNILLANSLFLAPAHSNKLL